MFGIIMALIGFAIVMISIAFTDRSGSFALLCIGNVIAAPVITSSIGSIIKCLNKSA